MPSPTIVIAQHDPGIAKGLARDLCPHFARVLLAEDARALRDLLQHHEARVAVLDLELISIEEVHRLSALFGDLLIVCTHRSPDEQMWTAALNAGAAEFCHPQDLRTILHASRTATPMRATVQQDDLALAA
jgi:DNA-binding NarL/FixJ family response regulator